MLIMRLNGKTIDRLTALLLPLLPALLGCFKIINSDIGFHVATGRAIDLFGRIPATNVLSFTQTAEPWVLHQWVPAYLFHLVDSQFGLLGLVLMKCAVLYATFLFLWLALRTRAESRWFALLWFVVAASAASCRFFVRPFIFSMLGLSIILYLFARFEQKERPAWLAAAAAVAGLFASLHAGVLYGLLLFLAFAVAAAAAWLATRRPPEETATMRNVVVAFLVALLLCAVVVSLESPWGIESLSLPFRFTANEYYHQHLAEFRPLPFDLAIYPFAWILLVGCGVMLCVFAYHTYATLAITKGLRCFAFELFAAAGFAFLLLRHQRLVYAFSLVAAFVLARWSNALVRQPGWRRWMDGLVCAAAVAAAASGLLIQFSDARFGPGVDDRFYPRRIIEFVQQKGLPDNAYVSDSWGGHWLWAFYPERRAFYDNRLEAYSFDFFRNAYQSIRYGEDGWQDKLDSYGVNTMVLKYSTPGERKFQEGRLNVRDLAFISPRWRLVFWDDIGMVLVKNEGTPGKEPPCPECEEFRYFNPDTLQPVPGAAGHALRRELDKAWTTMPSGRSCFALTLVLLNSRREDEAVRLLKQGIERFPDNPLLLGLARSLSER